MLDASFIGDELTATGFALVGIHTAAAPESRDRLWQLVLEERERRQLVMLSAECARRIRDRLDALIERQPVPPIVVLPDPGAAQATDGAIRDALDALGLESGTG